MALQICLTCTAAYSAGAPRCPQCGGKKWVEQGSKGDPALAGKATPEADAAPAGQEAPNA
jgi:hypothetical protein